MMVVAMAVGLVGLHGGASADGQGSGIGPPGSLIIGVERLFGAAHTRSSVDLGPVSSSTSGLHLSLLGTVEPLDRSATLVYVHPRLCFDVALLDRFTLGGAVGLGYSRTSFDVPDASGPTQLSLVFAPRAGLAMPLGSSVLWLRGGVSYFRLSSDDDDFDVDRTLWGVAATIEPTLVLFPVDWLGFSIAAVIDLPLTGRRILKGPTGTLKDDASMRQLGLMAGVLGRI
jgi:hypothetical protein